MHTIYLSRTILERGVNEAHNGRLQRYVIAVFTGTTVQIADQ